MTNKIFRSAFFTSLFVLLASLLLIFITLLGYFERQLTRELETETDYIAYAIRDGYEPFFRNFSSDDRRVSYIASDGTVLADTSADPQTMENHADRAEVRQALAEGSGTSARYSRTLTRKTIYYARRLENGCVLRLSATRYSAAAILLGLAQPILLVLVIAFALSWILSARAAKSVLRPINAIDVENPEQSEAYDELAPLLHKIANQKRTIQAQLVQAQKMQEEFRLITENMNEGFLVIDQNALLLSHNTAALRLLDARETDGSVLTLNRSSSFREVIRTALSGKRDEQTMRHGEKTYNLIASPVFDRESVIGAVILIIDITETAEREALRREFTANVSHELKTPLTSISGFAELMKSGGMPEQTVMDFSASIYEEAQRLIALVSDIIKISALDENNPQFTAEEVDLFEIASQMLKSLKTAAQKKHVTLELDGQSAYVWGVRRILEEMVYNLCDNAVKYNRENGSVTVSVTAEGESTVLSVRDTGIGIPPSCRDRVFERFFRVDKGRSKAEGGTGLGLSIVKHGAMYHHAEISLESEPEKGTCITLRFPETTAFPLGR